MQNPERSGPRIVAQGQRYRAVETATKLYGEDRYTYALVVEAHDGLDAMGQPKWTRLQTLNTSLLSGLVDDLLRGAGVYRPRT
jgi:hypothetical protein